MEQPYQATKTDQEMGERSKHFVQVFLKKRFLSAFLLLIVVSPLLLVIVTTAIFIWITDGCPVVFCQARLGESGRVFKLLKFRTMQSGKGSDSVRLLWFGEFMRRWSIDETISFVHVILGDLRIVGPRPFLICDKDLLYRISWERFGVSPGITGLAQIAGRNGLSWRRRLSLDLRYVSEKSMWLDVFVIALTVKAVFVGEGICSPGRKTGIPLCFELSI